MSLLSDITTVRSQIGELYYLGSIGGPDPRFSEDLAAIDDYVRTQARPKTIQYPDSLKLIEDYETWRQGLGWYDLNVVPNDTMNSAKAKRDAINKAQQNLTPADREVEKGSFITSPPDVSKNTLSPITKLALEIGAGLGAVLLLAFGVSKLSPMALGKRALGRFSKKGKES